MACSVKERAWQQGVLESLGVTLDKVRAETHRILSHSAGAGSQGSRTASRTPTLDQLGVDLTVAARSEKLDPVVGREQEIQRVDTDTEPPDQE